MEKWKKEQAVKKANELICTDKVYFKPSLTFTNAWKDAWIDMEYKKVVKKVLDDLKNGKK